MLKTLNTFETFSQNISVLFNDDIVVFVGHQLLNALSHVVGCTAVVR